ncbi:MAG: flagellar basal body P-ring protein FlgI [Planctomycetota bacterium]|nr:flagellar basal body P-ring protein FlgI [Planctomycetota bacterium]
MRSLAHSVVLALAVGLLSACGGSPKPAPRPRAPDADAVRRDVPSVLRDTIGAQATLTGAEPVLISGYGFVVGLNGTGGGDVPGPIRSVMERELTFMGVGREVGPFAGVSPTELLSDPNTAVVLVTAAIPAGAPKGTRFDVQIDTVPGSSTTSLEGGRLYTTRLFRGLVRPNSPSTEAIAEAKGTLFINPFADPAQQDSDAKPRTTGRILNGGAVLKPDKAVIALDTPSHSRVRAAADAINERFPRGRGDEPVARGRNEELIEIIVPRDYRDKPDEFFALLMKIRVDSSFPDAAAQRYVRALRDEPELSEELALCLEALGPSAIPHIRSMYSYPEVRPRLAAITAGAKLGDLTTKGDLEDLATNGPPGLRPSALRLMGALPTDPSVNEFLRDQLDARALDVRIAAYEALLARNDPRITRRKLGDKFLIETVPSAEPMVYVTMQKAPKIVLFGEDLGVRRPVFASVWDDRLMVSSENENQPIRVFYRDYRGERVLTAEIKPLLTELVEYLAHTTTPEEPAPGLDLSYSEVVGALAVMLRKGVASAAFVPETDRLQLELIRAQQTEMGAERPETAPDDSADLDDADEDAPGDLPRTAAADRPETPAAAEDEPADAVAQPGAARKRQYVVPLAPPTGQQAAPADGKPPKKSTRPTPY